MKDQREKDILEFIQLAHKITKPIIDQYVDPHVAYMRKYYASEKGKERCRIGAKKRTQKMSKLIEELTWEELKNIKQFYRNTPKGYQVDHIIPVSRGGKHSLSNLQYLTRDENARKYNRLPDDPIGW